MRYEIVGLVLALGIAGCATQSEWSKSGVSPQLAAQDLADCRGQAQEALRRDTDISTDILASRGADWQRNGFLSLQQSSFAAENHDQSQRLVMSCMIGKGYAPGAGS